MKIILSLFFVLLHSVLSYAYNQFSFVKYQVENGLSHNTVWYTIQDHQGFMWFGTSDGLNRFDGKNFKFSATSRKTVLLWEIILSGPFSKMKDKIFG